MIWEKILRKMNKRITLNNNKAKGYLAETSFVVNETLKGSDVRRTGRGSDFEVTKRDLWTGKSEGRKLVEVKSGDSKLSKLQERTKRRNKGRYSVVRY